VYDDAVVDLVEFDHFICDSAVLNCSGSFMSLQIFAILWNLCVLSLMVSSFLPSLRISSAYLSRSGVLFTGRCSVFNCRRSTPASLELDREELSSTRRTLRSLLWASR